MENLRSHQNTDQPDSVEFEEKRRRDLRRNTSREELVRRIGRAVPKDGTVQSVHGLHLNRVSSTIGPFHGVAYPAFCVIAQGIKEVSLGDEHYRYDPDNYLLATVELPVVSRLVEASPERPYLSLRLDLDPGVVASVMLEAGLPGQQKQSRNVRAIDVSSLDADLLDAALRLVRLADAPSAKARVLMPLVTREIVFLLLTGSQGVRLRHLSVLGGPLDRIARAIGRLRSDFDQPLRIEGLARELGMNPTSFHAHFKAVTAMSPLQFQKNLRLQEARRLMLGEDFDAAGAAFRVGYEDTSHFSREYKRLFGEPPMRDVGRLRQAAGMEVGEAMGVRRKPE